MNPLVKSAVWRGALGFALGVPVNLGILCWARPDAFAGGMSNGALLTFILSGGLYGALALGSSVAYDIERWSVARATLTHLLVALGGMYLLGLVQGWLALTPFGFFIPTAGFIALYFLIWLVQYLSLRRKVGQMNRGIKRRRNRGRQSPLEYE